MSGIVLIHKSSLSPLEPSAQRFDALRCPVTDDFALIGYTSVFVFSNFVRRSTDPLSTKSSPCVIPDDLPGETGSSS